MIESCWAPGQLYVALSRVRSVEDMHIIGKITVDDLICSNEVKAFYERNEDLMSDTELPWSMPDKTAESNGGYGIKCDGECYRCCNYRAWVGFDPEFPSDSIF